MARWETRVVGQGPGTRPQETGTRPIGEPISRPVAAPVIRTKPTCAAVKKDGHRCGALPIKGVGICIGHKRQEEANRAKQG